jgi:methyl-accepting chemotaxis protein
MKLNDLKLGVRLGIAFSIISALMIVIIAIAVSMLSKLNGETSVITKERWPAIEISQKNYAEANNIAIAVRNMMLSYDPADQKKELDSIQTSRSIISKNNQALQKMIADSEAKTLLQNSLNLEAKYVAGLDKVLEMISMTMNDDAKKYLVVELRPVFVAYKDSLNQLVVYQAGLLNKAGNNADGTYANTRNLVIAIGFGGLILAAVIGFFIARSITSPMKGAVQIAQAVALGDLTTQIDVTSKDETGLLLQSLKDMNESLFRIVDEVRAGANTIATATNEVALGTRDLSSRTEHQANSLRETASSMEELTSTVKQNADNTRQANNLAASASEVAVAGGTVVAQVVNTMDSINNSAKKIVDIISVIDGIAFQTNILALNAAVEAARAGEQGKGFAVVAAEVRTLAQRSANAAKEIKALIHDSVSQVQEGTKLVDQAGATMTEIVASVKRVTDIIGEISAANQEQTSGIEQINKAIAQMDEVTQQNATLVEQASAASESLQNQADNLSRAVSVFRLGQDTAPLSLTTLAPVAALAA